MFSVLSMNSVKMLSAENSAFQISSANLNNNNNNKKQAQSMTVRVLQLSTSANSRLGMLVKFVAGPVVWWELSSRGVTHTQTRTLRKPATVYISWVTQP